MGLIGYHDDIATIREQPRTLFKFLNSRKNDATRLQVFQFAHQVLSPTRLSEFALLVQVETYALGLLAQELLTACKLLIQLLVQIVTIRHHHDGTFRVFLYQTMHVKHHRETLTRALCMPEHADLSIASDSRCRVRHRLIHSKILMIGRHDFGQASVLMIEALKVVQDIYQPLLLKDATKECFIISNLVCFFFTIHASI